MGTGTAWVGELLPVTSVRKFVYEGREFVFECKRTVPGNEQLNWQLKNWPWLLLSQGVILPELMVYMHCSVQLRRDEDVDVKSVGKLKTEIVVPGTVFVGAYREYTADDVAEAIELVHGGMPVIDAAFRFGIPRATLFVRSRQGCPTHTGRCSTVFARTHQEAAASARRNRPKLQYTKEAVEAAIDAVHNGVPVIDAAIQFNIPRATLFNRSGKGCPTHEGRCSTVFNFLTFDQGNQVSLDFMEDTYEEANDFEEDDDDLPIEIDIAHWLLQYLLQG
ncbi:hypothetical protein BaRGS_00035384, partial [Batillaria attramentaria]